MGLKKIKPLISNFIKISCMALALVFTVFVAMIFIFFMFEWIYRVRHEHESGHTYNVDRSLYAPYPYIGFKPAPQGETPLGLITERHLGYFGPRPPIKKDHTFRIFILGGSATISGQPDTIAVYLERKLLQLGFKNIRVFNFGAGSSMIGQDVSRLLHEVVDYHPNLVIFYNGYNEFAHPGYADPRPGYPFNFIIEEANPIRHMSAPEKFYKTPFFAFFLYQSMLLRKEFPGFFLERFTGIDALRERVGHGSEEWKKEIAESYWSYVQKARSLGKAYNFEVLVVFQALRYKKHILVGIERSSVDKSSTDLEDIYQYLNKIINDNNFFFDRRDFFSNFQEKVFTDAVHIKGEYNRHIAHEIAKITLSTITNPTSKK